MSETARRSPLAAIIILAVHVYRAVPRWGPPRCRFVPSCSAYALQAVERHGALRGARLTAVRLLRCHPFHPGGIDHVPPVARARADQGSFVKGSFRV